MSNNFSLSSDFTFPAGIPVISETTIDKCEAKTSLSCSSSFSKFSKSDCM